MIKQATDAPTAVVAANPLIRWCWWPIKVDRRDQDALYLVFRGIPGRAWGDEGPLRGVCDGKDEEELSSSMSSTEVVDALSPNACNGRNNR